MTQLEIAEVKSRLGCFAVIKMGQLVLVSPCDTRMRILKTLSKRALTGEELAGEMDVSYSCVMDHMELLENLGIVTVSRRKSEGRRKIHFHLSTNPLEGIEALFMTTTKTDDSGGKAETLTFGSNPVNDGGGPSIPV